MKKIIFVLIVICFILSSNTSGFAQNTYANISADSAYAMVQANINNPDFIILDVRTPAEYIPEHLENAVNLNYYNSDFSETLDTLIKTKKYLIHCHSGSRSGRAFKIMKELEFKEVYNLLGGISAWKNKNHPITSVFKPVLMKVTKDSIIDFGNIHTGYSDTIDITITNFGNDILKFTDFTDLSTTEFSTNFDSSHTLTGLDDYTFHVIYSPINYASAYSEFSIKSNGGNLTFSLQGFSQEAAVDDALKSNGFTAYPNPTSGFISIKNNSDKTIDKIDIIDIFGNRIRSFDDDNAKNTIDLRNLDTGIYFINIFSDKSTACIKMIRR